MKVKIKKRILLTNAGTTVAQNVIEYNQDSGLDFYGVDMNNFCWAAAFLKDKFFTVPVSKNWSYYEKKILTICRRHKIDLVISCSDDEELIKLIHDRAEFEKVGAKILGSSYQATLICNDKVKCSDVAKKLGIKTPAIYSPNNLPPSIKFPLFAKNRYGGGSALTKKIENPKDMLYFRTKYKDLIFQEYIEGMEYSLDMVLDNNSEIIVAGCRERIAVKSGLCVKTKIVDNQKLIGYAAKIAKELKLVNGINMQFIGDNFIEVNPRLPGGLGLISQAGFNMSLLAIKAFYNLPISDSEKVFKKTKVLRIWQDIIYEK